MASEGIPPQAVSVSEALTQMGDFDESQVFNMNITMDKQLKEENEKLKEDNKKMTDFIYELESLFDRSMATAGVHGFSDLLGWAAEWLEEEEKLKEENDKLKDIVNVRGRIMTELHKRIEELMEENKKLKEGK